jgi:hypothetical protein
MKSRNTYAYGRKRSQYSENCLRQRRFYEGMGKLQLSGGMLLIVFRQSTIIWLEVNE